MHQKLACSEARHSWSSTRSGCDICEEIGHRCADGIESCHRKRQTQGQQGRVQQSPSALQQLNAERKLNRKQCFGPLECPSMNFCALSVNVIVSCDRFPKKSTTPSVASLTCAPGSGKRHRAENLYSIRTSVSPCVFVRKKRVREGVPSEILILQPSARPMTSRFSAMCSTSSLFQPMSLR